MQFPNSWFEDEVRNGFYVPALMKRAWAAHLEVLEDVAKICEKHHIHWFADFGTMLGAVRHGGFIPWDDDIDICMLPDDYIRFNEIVEKELPKGYYIPRNQENDYRVHTTVWCTRDVCMEKEHLEKFHGFPFVAGVDIFPVYFAAPDLDVQRFHKQLLRIVCNAAASIDTENQNTPKSKELVAEVEELLHIRLDGLEPLKEQLFSLLGKLLSQYTAEEAKEVAHVSWFFYDLPRKYPIKCFRESVMMPFEVTTLPVPAGYDTILKTQFGDYMKCCRTGSSHDYPFYNPYIERLTAEMAKNGMELKSTYQFSMADLEKTKEGTLTEDFVQLARAAHEEIRTAMRQRDPGTAMALLEACQTSAIQIGNALEQTQGEAAAPVVSILEEYCEMTFQIHEELFETSAVNTEYAYKRLDKQIIRIENWIKKNVRTKREVVFLPYKASLWNSMKPAWKKAAADPDCSVYVIPIPYHYKNLYGESGELCYEGDQFPSDVPVTDYNSYDFKNRQPDVIFIQNPYDEYNLTTSVPPFFYSGNLGRFTDKLVYISPFVLDETDTEEPRAKHNMKYYAAMPGVVHADQVIVQSERMRLAYIDFLTEFAGENTRSIWEEKIRGGFEHAIS